MGSSGVLVVGGGVSGIKASLDLAKFGFKVFVAEREPFFGGKLPFLHRQFPTDRCRMCYMLLSSDGLSEELCLKRAFYHPGIETILCAEPVEISGRKGSFSVKLRVHPRGVREDLCTGCGRCIGECPVEVRDEVDPTSARKAVYIRHEVYPPIPAIDWSSCIRCGRCVDVCPEGAIELEGGETFLSLDVGYVVLSQGFDLVDPKTLSQYGYGRFQGVVTGLEFEGILASSLGRGVLEIGDGRRVKSVAFVLCAGSREVGAEFCSSTCCMYSLKQAYMVKELFDDIDVSVFYTDLRAYGTYHRYSLRVDELGIKLIRGRVPRLFEDPVTKKLLVTVLDGGRVEQREFDLVVLATGKRPPKGLKGIGVELDRWGFVKVDPSTLKTSRDGIYACGAVTGPKDIHDSVVEASSVAFGIARDAGLFEKDTVSAGGSRGGVGVVLCRCGGDVDTKAIKDRLIRLGVSPGDIVEVDDLCLGRSAPNLSRFGKVVVGACSPYFFRERFMGFHKRFSRGDVEWVDIKGKSLYTSASSILFSFELLKGRPSFELGPSGFRDSVLVVGGGFSGLLSSVYLGEAGLEVHLVDKGDSLGGSLRGRKSKKELLSRLLERVDELGIRVYTGSTLLSADGVGGNFVVSIAGGSDRFTLNVGAIVLATGSVEEIPSLFGYGEDERVITQKELGNLLLSGGLDPSVKKVVMVQCVGSRDERHPWCSRYCCLEAIENATKLASLGIEVFVLHRDIMTFGLKEDLYLKAREMGVVFIRYGSMEELHVSRGDRVRVAHGGMGLALDCDMLVLSTGCSPNPDNRALASILRLDLDESGFFAPSDPKFRPLEADRSGIFFCGGAVGPYLWEEVEAQALSVSGAVVGMLKGLKPRFPVAFVNGRRCSSCLLCVDACPYGARVFDGELGFVKVEPLLCQGCGVCVSVCPNGASELSWGRKNGVALSLERVLSGGGLDG